MTKIIIASSKNWFFKNINVKKFIKKKNIKVIKKKGQLKHTYLRKINPQIISTGNIGCINQIATGTNIPILHTVEVIDWYTGGPKPRVLKNI